VALAVEVRRGRCLLIYGLKYNLHYKQKHWIQTLAIEADTAINLLNSQEQTYMRQAVTHKLQILTNKEKTHQKTNNTQNKTRITRKETY
jgi:hypothetical protein